LPELLTSLDLFSIAKGERQYSPPPNSKTRCSASSDALQDYLSQKSSQLLYGIDTGFGPHAFQNNEDRLENQKSLVYHLTVSDFKDRLSHIEARAVLCARIHSLSQGGSGISWELLELLMTLLEIDCIPVIPAKGSLSASGDLIPLSAIALSLMGEGLWTGKGHPSGPTIHNDKKSEVTGLPRVLQPKEAISLTNGTSFSTALLSIQLESTHRLHDFILDQLETLFRFHSVFADAFFPALHKTKRHSGPIQIANRLYPIVSKNSKTKIEGKRIQDIYSIRCIPQILGSILDELDGIRLSVENELNSLSDNPVYIEEEKRFVEGGNFYASQVSFAADRLQNCLAVLATWIERFIQYLYNPTENNDFPLMLSPQPGRYAGLSGIGLLATHLTADIRRDSMPGSVQSLSSNGGNQDIVPMGAISILRNRRSLDSLNTLVSILTYSIFQAGTLKGFHFPKDSIYTNLVPLKSDARLDGELAKIKSLFTTYSPFE